jgi:glycosyltransferase involved in cell wall biosynthesis
VVGVHLVKVCLVYSSGLSTSNGGGIATKIQNIVKLSLDHVDYTILSPIGNKDLDDVKSLRKKGVTIVDLSYPSSSLSKHFRMLKAIFSGKFDAVHFHELPLAWNFKLGLLFFTFLLKCKAQKIPLVYEHQIAVTGNLSKFQIAFQYVIYKALFRLWTVVIVNSNYMKHEVESLVSRDPSKIALIPNGVNLKEIQDSIPKVLTGTTLLFFGHLTRIKGIDVVLEAFKEVSEFNDQVHLYIVGAGPLRNSCEQFVKKEKLSTRVHFMGVQPQNILFSIIKGADICVLPSRNEAGPLTVLEAMAAGKPLITTCVGLVPDILIDSRNALLVNCETHQIAVAIKHLLQNKELSRTMSENNLCDIQDYSWNIVSKEYLRLYDSIVKTYKK